MARGENKEAFRKLVAGMPTQAEYDTAHKKQSKAIPAKSPEQTGRDIVDFYLLWVRHHGFPEGARIKVTIEVSG